jgi:hypothetical protein
MNCYLDEMEAAYIAQGYNDAFDGQRTHSARFVYSRILFALLPRDLLDAKIRKCRKEMLDTYRQIEFERIQAQINNNEDKDTKTRGESNEKY